MKINIRHYILIIFAFISVAVTMYGYSFIYKKTISQAELYVRTNDDLKDEDVKKQSEQDLIKVYNATAESRPKIASFFVDKIKVVDFIETIEKIGTDSNTVVEISSINNDDTKVKAKILAKGSWGGIMKALILIENLPLNILITNARLDSKDDSENKTSVWILSLDVEAFIFKIK
jgi:hypothetical protein